MKVISFAHQKGGVGKTTTAVNLSAALALEGKRVLFLAKKEVLGVKPREIEMELSKVLKPLCLNKSRHLPLKKGEVLRQLK